MKLDKEEDDIQVNTLLYVMGKEAEPIFSTFTFVDDEENHYGTVIKKFNEHFVPKRNIIHKHACFHRCSQRQGETVEAFIRHLYELAEYCELGVAKDEQIRDWIVIGILDIEVSQKLQLEQDLTLEKAINMAHQLELIKAQRAATRSTDGERKHANTKSMYVKSATKPVQGDSCSRCGRMHESGACPAFGKRCYKCDKTGYFGIVCKSKAVRAVKMMDSDSNEGSTWFLGTVAN